MTKQCPECGVAPRYRRDVLCRNCRYRKSESSTGYKDWLDFAEPGEDSLAARTRLGREVAAARREGVSLQTMRHRYGVSVRTLWRWQKLTMDRAPNEHPAQ